MMKYKIPLVLKTFYKNSTTIEIIRIFLSESEKLSMGEKCQEFESRFSRYQNCKYAVFFSSGSAANLALIQSLSNLGKIKKNDNIAISSLTWSTNVMPIIQLGMNPVPVDVDLENLNINLAEFINKHKKYHFKAIFLTNALSFTCDLFELRKFCIKNSIILLEDNCESLGTELNGVKSGNFGFASTFSFFVGHQMSTIEGGMIATNDEELYEMLKMVRAHGWSRENKTFNTNDFYAKYRFYDLGYNLRPQEINGLAGIIQLKFLKTNLKKRFDIFKAIHSKSLFKKSIYHLKPQNNFYAPFSYPLVFKDKEYSELIKKRFIKSGVEIRPIISGNIAKQPFFKKYIKEKFELRNCNIIHNNGFYFGINPDLKKSDLKYLFKIIDFIK